MIFQKSFNAVLPAVFIVIEQHWPKIKLCNSYRVFMKSICQITFSVVSRSLFTAARSASFASAMMCKTLKESTEAGWMTSEENHVI